MKENEILDLYWERDEASITATGELYGGYCCSIAYNILKSREDSDECVNDTWLKAWNTIPPQHPNKLSLFLGRITRNLSFDKLKAERTRKRGGGEIMLVLEELEECIPSAGNVEQKILDEEFGKMVNRFLHMLPERECGIFLFRYWYSRSIKEIAERFAMKENSVKASLFRSRAKIKNYLEKEGILL